MLGTRTCVTWRRVSDWRLVYSFLSLQMEKRAAELEVSRAQADELRMLREEKEACARRCRDLDSQVAINRERKRLAQEEARTELRAAEEAERVYKAKLEQFKVDTIEQSRQNYGVDRNYGIRQLTQAPMGLVQHFARP